MGSQELLEAVERLREKSSMEGCLIDALARDVADALTDPAPLGRTALIAAGFTVDPNDDDPDWMDRGEYESESYLVATHDIDADAADMWLLQTYAGEVEPQPETVGDLNWLLLRLSRTPQQEGGR